MKNLPPSAHLVVLGYSSLKYVIEDEITTIGRLTACNVTVIEDGVSREHARIEYNALYYFLVDNHSKNGTYLNGQKLSDGERCRLNNRDEIGLASPKPLLRFYDARETETHFTLLHYDMLNKLFVFQGKKLDLSPQQHDLLLLLYKHVGDICSHKACEKAVWKEGMAPSINALHRLVSELRSKLAKIDQSKNLNKFIKNHPRKGYSLSLDSL